MCNNSTLTPHGPIDAARSDGETEASPRARTTVPELEPGAPSDLALMQGIQAEDPAALSQLYDRYNGILKALILRVIPRGVSVIG